MKNSIVSLAVVTISLAAIVSCSKSNEEEMQSSGNGCDTVNMTYSADVKPIISNNCYSCHGNGINNGGVQLDSYEKVLVQVNNGNLINVITHAPGFPAMPQGAPKLAECDINKIKDWIARGAQNN